MGGDGLYDASYFKWKAAASVKNKMDLHQNYGIKKAAMWTKIKKNENEEIR